MAPSSVKTAGPFRSERICVPIPRRIKKPSCTEPAMTHLAKRGTISDKNARVQMLSQTGAQARGSYIGGSRLATPALLPQLRSESAPCLRVAYFALQHHQSCQLASGKLRHALKGLIAGCFGHAPPGFVLPATTSCRKFTFSVSSMDQRSITIRTVLSCPCMTSQAREVRRRMSPYQM